MIEEKEPLGDVLIHYGIKRRSGRYPWGSGENPYQHSADFLARVEEFEKQGMSEKDIAENMRMTTTDLRMQVRNAKHERRALQADRARSLRDDGKSLNEIAAIMGFKNDSSVRALLNENTAVNKNRANVTADKLAEELEEKGFLDVGAGAEKYLGVSQGTLKEALFILQTRGYEVYGIGVPQVTNVGKQTNTAVLCKPGTEHKEVYDRIGDIQSVGEFHSIDGGTTFQKLQYPASINSDRVHIRYGDEGGKDKDGVIEIRRGVADLDLGASHYAQVRILVDGTHYLKGMAMYSDDLPEGSDIVFNTNKLTGTPKNKVMKAIKDDPENPFGAYIKANGQSTYIDSDGNKKLSAINKVKEEGDWDNMSKNLSSQFLSKQPISLISKQLDLTYKDKVAEYDEIMSLTNPTLRKKLLLDFADECDGDIVHLKAAALPRQSTQVILPLTKIKEDEIYAPNYRDGEQVALVRYPHAGTFEIPILTVNNKNAQGNEVLGKNIVDAVGIHPKVAERLSGADFDGDQVVVIPTNNRVRIQSTKKLRELENFDPKTEYAERPGMKVMSKQNTQKQMGMVSNLITDMTLRGASEQELARAVKHSMVVIDAEKHRLDYKQSEKDQGIAELKSKYQGYIDDEGKYRSGASTLLSRRKQDVRVPARKGSAKIDPETGEVFYNTSGRKYIDKKGNLVEATDKAKLLNQTKDLRTLSSGTQKENLYADYGNKLKALANEARKASLTEKEIKYSSTAKTIYSKEVESLNAKLNLAIAEAPKERRAQAIANSQIKAKMQAYPEIRDDKKLQKKIAQQAIENARISVGKNGKSTMITFTDREWEAIQAGAISPSKLKAILENADAKSIREKAMPKTRTVLSEAKINKIKAMSNSGYSNSEIADAIGISTSSVYKYINE